MSRLAVSTARDFLAKLLVLVLVFQSLAPARQASSQPAKQPPAKVRVNSAPAPHPSTARSQRSRPPFPLLAKGELPRYVPASPADPADPYMIAQAAALNNDPNQIFTFVRDQIAFEAYTGSVRGARGALWAMAANSLDKASLLVALLGAAGFTAQYEHASIGSTTAQNKLILGMFPPTTTFVGCLPSTALTDSPLNNGYAAQGSADYYWVQYGVNGANNTALDPNVAGATPGQTFQTPDSNFTTVPANLRQQVTVKINAELYSQANSLFGGGPGTSTVLTQTFDASALVGSILTVGNLVSASGGGGLDISATSFTYTPFLLVGSGGPKVNQDQLITGTPYQEMFTNFPLGSSVLTGLFLEIDADDTTYTPQKYVRTLFDRLGPAARAGNATVNLSLPATPAPALTQFDLTSVNVNTARQPLSSIAAQKTRLQNAYNSYENFKPQLASLPTAGPLNAEQQEVEQQAMNLGEYLTVAENELIAMSYNYTADLLAQQLQTIYYSRVYPNSPRITIAAAAYNGGNTQEMIDVLKNDMFVLGGVGQNRSAPFEEEIARGTIESLTESSILNQATGQTNSIGIGEVFGALGDPNLLTVIGPQVGPTPSNVQALVSTTLSADAQTLIQNDIAAGNVVIAPSRMVTVNGVSTAGWWETNPISGHTISHFANGGHQAIIEDVAADIAYSYLTGSITEFIGRMEGFGAAGFVFAADVLQGVASGTLKTTKNLLANPPALLGLAPPPNVDPISKFFDNMSNQLLQFGVSTLKYTQTTSAGIQFGVNVFGFVSALNSYLAGFAGGYYDEIKALTANLPKDPDSLSFISTPLGLTPSTPNPGTTPGVQVGAITVDPTYTIPVNGNSLPLVFDLPVTNTGPTTDTFNIQLRTLSQYFQVSSTVNSLTLAGGQSGMVNVCVVPYDGAGAALPPPGQAQDYSITVSSATNPSVTATAQPTFNTPSIPALEVSTDPSSITLTPGGTLPVNLNVASLGNVAAGPVTLTATVPAGITLNGLTSPLTVPLNGATTEPLSITAAANSASGGYPVTLIASYTPAGGTPQFSNIQLPVSVTPLGTCALNSAAQATQLGKTTLAADLSALASEMDQAAAAPSNTALTGRVVGNMSNLISQELTATYFQSIVPNLTAANNAVAAATPANLNTALGNLSTALCSIGTLLGQVNTTGATLTLLASNTLADQNMAIGPNQSAQWNVFLINKSPVLHVYNLSISGLPAGISAQFSQPTVTLGPFGSANYQSYATVLTVTTGATFNTPFSFTVTATPQDAPEFPVSTAATLLARPESISVDQVTATPAYANAGTPITVSARIFSVVNETLSNVTLQLSLTDPTGRGCCARYVNVTLTPSTSVQTITFPSVDTTGFSNGVYQLSVQAQYGSVVEGPPASASLLIGSPLTGVLTANPSVVGPGSSTVQASLAISRDNVSNPVSTLVGTVGVNGTPRAMTLYQNGAQQLAYVCSDSQVNIVDVTNTAKPVVLGTFANDILTTESGYPGDPGNGVVTGFQVMSCAIYNNDFLISYSRFNKNITSQPIPTHFATYSLANPLAPHLVGSVVDIPRSDSAGLYVAGNNALMFQSTTFYNTGSNFIEGFTGDIWAADLTSAPATGGVAYLNDVYSCGGINPATNACNNATNVPNASYVGGVCTPNGTIPIANDPTRGGPYRISGGTAVNANTSYFASSDSYSGNTLDPTCPAVTGQLLVVDTSNPSQPSVVTSVPDPAMAFLTGIAIQGNTALAVGDSIGIYDINSGYYGTLVISSFDISNPRSPVLLNSISTQLTDKPGSFVVPLGMNTFAVGNTSLGGKAELVLVDASNPHALRYIPYDALFVANPTIAQNGYFFALSSIPSSTQNALSVFQLSQISGPQLSVSLQIPTTGNASLVAGSFNPPPDTTTPGTGYNTYVWNQPTQNTITFNMSLSGVNPGDVTTLVNSGQMNFTVPALGSGVYPLGSLSVLTQHVLSINPPSQSVIYAGDTANYTATIANPTGAPLTFSLSTIVPQGWSGVVPANLTVPANGSQNFNVAVTPPVNVQAGGYTFNVVASTAAGISDSVPAVLSVNQTGPYLGGNGNANFTTFNASVSPSQVIVGQGDYSTPYTLTFTNTGSYNFAIGANGSPNLPNGVSFGSYQPIYYAQLSPNQTGSITGTVLAGRGTTPGTYPVTIPIQAGYAIENLTLNIKVSSAGVGGYLSPNPGTTSSGIALNLSNYGQAQDTFSLSIVGPLAQAASIEPTVTLAAGASSPAIPIQFDSVNYLVPANAPLQIKAVSQNDPNVQALITGAVTVSAAKSVTAAILPGTNSVTTTPATVNLLFDATNTGNVGDSYSARITGTTGSVTASLVDSSGNSGQSIASFYAAARGTAQFPLNANVTGGGTSTVTVGITSLSNPGVTSSATVTINGPVTQTPPAANAGTGGNTPLHRLAPLNGTASVDTNTPPLPLTYAWSLVSAPAGSTLSNASIGFATSATASFRPDVLGSYTFKLTVTTSAGSNSANVTYNAVDAVPIAVAGNSSNAAVGGFAFLDGRNSYDPDGQPITFAWTLVSAPHGSTLTSASINNSQTPRAFFTPDVAGAYQFQLVVSDAGASSQPALVTVTASSSAVPPNADAGPDQNAALHSTVTLNGGKSFDPNPSPPALNYQWTLTTVPAGSGAALANAASVSPQFTPDVAGAYIASLVVSNADGTSAAASTTVNAFAGDVPPNASAGPAQFVLPGSTATLNAQASADPDNGPLNLAFLWWLDSQPTGGSAALQQPNTASSTFVAAQSGYYIGRVEANDGLLAGFANTLVTSAAKCDADANGVVNQVDVQLVAAAVGQTALPNDPRDPDGSGAITQADVTYCTNLVNQNAPVLEITPSSFTESLAAGGPKVDKLLQISSSGNPISFTVSSNQPWLSASVTSGSTSSIGSLNAIVDPGSLTPNTYQGMLTFTPSVGVVQTVSVTLTVAPAVFSVSPTSVTVNLVQDSSQYNLPLQVSSTGGPINFTVGSGATWLIPSTYAGSTGTTGTVTAFVNDTGLNLNSYTGVLTFTPAGGAAETVTVNLKISPSAQITPNPGVLSFNANYGGAIPPSQTVNVTSTNGGTSFTVTSDSPWLTASSGTGSTPDVLAVTANPGGMVPGSYNGALTLTSGSFTSKVTATLNVVETGGISPCDIDRNGSINVVDVQKLINQALGVLAASSDLNSDGVVNLVDLQIDMNAVLLLGCSAH